MPQIPSNIEGAKRATALLSKRVRAEQSGFVIAFANLPIAIITALVISDSVPLPYLYAWVGTFALVLLARWRIYALATASDKSSRDRWMRYHTIGTTISGALWGALALYLVGSDDFANHIFLGFVIAGITAAALASLTWHLPAYLGFVLASTLPLALSYFLHGDSRHFAMGVLVAGYAGTLAAIARRHNKTIQTTLKLSNGVAALGRKLAIANEEIQRTRKEKWGAFAHLSHELRTPMNAVLGFSEILATEMLGKIDNPKYVEYAQHINESGAYALDLINEILEFSQAESGNLTLAPSAVNMSEIIHECMDMTRGKASEKNISISQAVPENLPIIVADPVKLRQVILNLLSNATKFSLEDSSISISARPDAEDGIAIAIKDRGIGMSTEDIPQALKPFVRLDNPLIKLAEGAGLGLPLAKRMVELHGGILDIDSAPGRGTTVTVRLPMDATAPSHMAPTAGSGARVAPADRGDEATVPAPPQASAASGDAAA